MPNPPPAPTLPLDEIAARVRLALDEDLRAAGDITSAALIPDEQRSVAHIVARHAGCLCGMEFAQEAFRQIDPALLFTAERQDGMELNAATRVATLSGRTRSILAAERVALNFLMHLSGIATATRAMVAAISGTKTRIADTRKTLPGLRAVQKYAVRAGGGVNHRFGLYDAILIKDNHLLAVGGDVKEAVRRAHAAFPYTLLEIEVESLADAEGAASAGADIIMLDNMSPVDVRAAVKIINGRARTEASGGMTLETVRAYAEAGVDVISVGGLTHSARALDFGLDFQEG